MTTQNKSADIIVFGPVAEDDLLTQLQEAGVRASREDILIVEGDSIRRLSSSEEALDVMGLFDLAPDAIRCREITYIGRDSDILYGSDDIITGSREFEPWRYPEDHSHRRPPKVLGRPFCNPKDRKPRRR